MKKEQEFKLGELLTLEGELLGTVNQATGEKLTEGLLQQEISFSDKYWLNDFVFNLLVNEKKNLDSLKNDLIIKWGSKDKEGNVFINSVIEEEKDGVKTSVINPKFISFNEEYNNLLSQTKTISINTFELENLKDIKTKETYHVFMKYFINSPSSPIPSE